MISNIFGKLFRVKKKDEKYNPTIMNSNPYIQPDLNYFSSINKVDNQSVPFNKTKWEIDDFLNNKEKRLYVIGDPGYGKTRLMQEIAIKGNNTLYIDLKKLGKKTVEEYIDGKKSYRPGEDVYAKMNRDGYYFKEGFKLDNSPQTIICLDAIDEIASKDLSTFRENLIDLLIKFDECSFIISGRTHNIINLHDIIPDDWPVVQVGKFIQYQIWKLIKQHIPNIEDKKIEELLSSTTMPSLNYLHFQQSFLEIPRYLMLCINLLKDPENLDLRKLSRFDLFDLFIKNKLKTEHDKLNYIDTSFIHKFLCLLALIMVIKQDNRLSKKEFTIIVDDVQSGIKDFIFNKISPDEFFKYTILKDDDDYLEFENQEFQEYLAACEMISWDSIEQVVYDLCYIPEIKSLNFSWYNTLSFVLEKHPDLFYNLIQKQISNRTTSEEFFSFILSNVTPKNIIRIPNNVKMEIFTTILSYHAGHHYLPYKNGNRLAYFYSGNGDDLLRLLEDAKNMDNCIAIANILKIFPLLCEEYIQNDRGEKWSKLIDVICKKHIDDKTIIGYGLPALAVCKEEQLVKSYESILDNIRNESDPFISAFFDALLILDNRNLTVKYILEFYRKNNLTFQMPINATIFIFDDTESVLQLMMGFASSNNTFQKFLDASSYYTENLIDKTTKAIDVLPQILDEAERIIINMLEDKNTRREHIKSKFIIHLCTLVVNRKPEFTIDIINQVKLKSNDYWIQDNLERFLPNLLNQTNIKECASTIMSDYGDYFFSNVFSYNEQIKPELYKIRSKYIKENKTTPNHSESIIESFKKRLYNRENAHISDVFKYYSKNYKEIKPIISEEDLSRFKEIIKYTLAKAIPDKTILTSEVKKDYDKNIYATTILSDLYDIVKIPEVELLIDIKPYRKALLSHISLNSQFEPIYKSLEPLTEDEITHLKKVFLDTTNDRNKINILTFTTFIKDFKVSKAIPILKELILKSDEHQDYEQIEIINTINEFENDKNYFVELIAQINKEKHTKLWFEINAILIQKFGNSEAIRIRCEEIKNRKFEHSEHINDYSPYVIAQSIPNRVSELTSFEFARPLKYISDTMYIEDYINLLDFSLKIWKKDSKKFGVYSEYIDDIVFSYFDNLKTKNSYEWITFLESEIDTRLKTYETRKSYRGQLDYLRRRYSEYIEKDKSLTTHIKKYNEQKAKKYLEVYSEDSLFNLLNKAIDEDLRKWVEIEGAYKMIQKYRTDTKKQTTEDLMQKTLCSQFENILLKKGLRGFDIHREVEQLDGTKPDFLIKYGFIGPMLIEIKRSGNNGFEGGPEAMKEYKKTLDGYLVKTHSKHGFYVIFNDSTSINFDEKIKQHKTLYKDTPIKVIGIDCMIEKEQAEKTKNV